MELYSTGGGLEEALARAPLYRLHIGAMKARRLLWRSWRRRRCPPRVAAVYCCRTCTLWWPHTRRLRVCKSCGCWGERCVGDPIGGVRVRERQGKRTTEHACPCEVCACAVLCHPIPADWGPRCSLALCQRLCSACHSNCMDFRRDNGHDPVLMPHRAVAATSPPSTCPAARSRRQAF